jgi:hypothetical protein
MADLAQFPARFLDHIDWVNQPPPPQARDTHALLFFLQNINPHPSPSPIFQGLLFYRQGRTPTSPITQEQNGLDGTGHVLGGEPIVVTPGFHADWARVHLRFRTQPTARIHVVLSLHSGLGTGFPLPGPQRRLVEFDEIRVGPVGDDEIEAPIQITLDEDTSNHWELRFTKTTVLLETDT